MPLAVPKNFNEAVAQFGGDRKRAALQLLQMEVSTALCRHVAYDRKTQELVVLANRVLGGDEAVQILPPARAPNAREIETHIDHIVSKFAIPAEDRPKVAGARLNLTL